MTPEEAQEQLARHRAEIDILDRQILELLNQRTRIVEQIGAVKRQCELPVYEPKREEAVFRNIVENNPGPITADAVRRIFERILDEMRTLQKQKLHGVQQRGA